MDNSQEAEIKKLEERQKEEIAKIEKGTRPAQPFNYLSLAPLIVGLILLIALFAVWKQSENSKPAIVPAAAPATVLLASPEANPAVMQTQKLAPDFTVEDLKESKNSLSSKVASEENKSLSELNQESYTAAVDIIKNAFGHWDYDVFDKYTGSYNDDARKGEVNTFERHKKEFGKMVRFGECQGSVNISRTYNGGELICASYTSHSQFETGKYLVSISLIRKNNRWDVFGYGFQAYR